MKDTNKTNPTNTTLIKREELRTVYAAQDSFGKKAFKHTYRSETFGMITDLYSYGKLVLRVFSGIPGKEEQEYYTNAKVNGNLLTSATTMKHMKELLLQLNIDHAAKGKAEILKRRTGHEDLEEIQEKGE